MIEKLLSDLEWEVLTSYLQGKTYQEIALESGQACKIHRQCLATGKEEGRAVSGRKRLGKFQKSS